MTEVFREVDEALRVDRLKAFWQKRKIAIVIALALLVSTTLALQGWRALQAKRINSAAEDFFAEISAPTDERDERQDAEDSPSAGGYRFLLQFQRARQAIERKDWQDAENRLEQLVEQRTLGQLYRDYARIQWALVAVERTRFPEASARLQPLVDEPSSSSFHALSLYVQASLYVATGNKQKALEALDRALVSPLLSPALQARIEQARNALQEDS